MRSSSVLAAGAFIEPGQPSGAEEPADADDRDDAEAEESDVSAAGDESRRGDHPVGDERDHPRSPGGEPASEEQGAEHRDAEHRGPFSFFSSWIRREPGSDSTGGGSSGSSGS
jgi:hypothetical protein